MPIHLPVPVVVNAVRGRLAVLLAPRGVKALIAALLSVALMFTAPVAQAAPTEPTPLVTCATTPSNQAALSASRGNLSGVYAGVILVGPQVDAAATIVNVGLDQGVTRRGIVIAVATAMTASSLQTGAIDFRKLGLFAQDADQSTALYTQRDRLDPVGASRMFFDRLVAQVPGYETDTRTVGDVADVVQETGAPAAVQTWTPLAEALTAKFIPAEKTPSAEQSVVAWLLTLVNGKASSPTPPLRATNVAFAMDPTPGTGSTFESTTTTPTIPSDAGSTTTTTDVTTTTTVSASSPGAAPSTESPPAPAPSSPVIQSPTAVETTTTDPTSTESGTDTAEPITTTPESTTTAEATPTSPETTAAPTVEQAPTSAPPAPKAAPAEVPASAAEQASEPDPAASADRAPAVVDVAPSESSDDVDPSIGPDTVSRPFGGAAIECAPNNNGGSTTFDPGYIVSDQVFYNSTAMSAGQVQAFLDAQGSGCFGTYCVKNLAVTSPDQPADQYCNAYPGGVNESAAAVIAKVSVACGINPQVMLTTLQKESALLTKSSPSEASYAAAWGWHCPDTGPGGSANCDPAYAGFFHQAYGMAKQWSRYRVDPQKYNYHAGQTVDILWNVAETGCGGAPVTIRNTATASLYNYTPYQPNAAALAAYPGVGDRCSAYGNRNFFFLFQKYFGVTGGGALASITVNGVQVTIPDNTYIPQALRGKTVTAPNAAVARGLASGFAAIGLPYVWGGGTNGGQADQGCSRGGGELNSCAGTVGYDCSGLTAYVLTQAGFAVGTNSGSQRAGGTSVPWAQGRPGDIIGYSGHVAIYLGMFDGTAYLLEAPGVGNFVHIRTVYTSNGGTPVDGMLHRYWN